MEKMIEQIIAIFGTISQENSKIFLNTHDGQKILLTTPDYYQLLTNEIGNNLIVSGKMYQEDSKQIMFVDHFEKIKLNTSIDAA